MEWNEYKNLPFTQGLQYAYVWWAGGSEERYKKMPVCLSSLQGCADFLLRIPPTYRNKWGNEVPVIRIRGKVFSENPRITDILLPSGIEKITSDTFAGCFSLKRLALPKTITLIPKGAFRDCAGLEEVYYEGSEEEWEKIQIVSQGVRVKQPQALGLYCEREDYAIAGNEPLLKAKVHFNCNFHQ